MTDSITFAKFQPILEEFANFQKFRQMSRVNHDWLKNQNNWKISMHFSKMLEPQVN